MANKTYALLVSAENDKLRAELAEARAQIAALEKQLPFQSMMPLLEELSEARAQIAAKDAALRDMGHALETQDYLNPHDIEWLTRTIDAALAAPARETT